MKIINRKLSIGIGACFDFNYLLNCFIWIKMNYSRIPLERKSVSRNAIGPNIYFLFGLS